VSHWAWIRRRLARSLRVRIGMLLLAVMVLPGIFAELVAADAPVMAIGSGGVVVFPAMVPPASHRGLDADAIAELHRDDFAIWPLVRSGPNTVSAAGPLAPSSWRHPLGTDAGGRDLLARVVYGARYALGITFVALFGALLLGGGLGALAGFAGGFWDEMLARPIELVDTFPAIVVVALVRAIDPDGAAWSLLAAVIAVRWAEMARLVRSEVMRLSSAPFVEAARAVGCSRTRVLRRHILPHAMRPVVVSLMFGVASVVLLEVAVAFMGLGLDGSWGVLIAEGLEPGAPLGPSLWGAGALVVTVLAAYLLADALGENLDARVATQLAAPGEQRRLP
jgi:peptide/nickel transport system permease protein